MALVSEKKEGPGKFGFDRVGVGFELEGGGDAAPVRLFEDGPRGRKLRIAEAFRGELDGLARSRVECVENVANGLAYRAFRIASQKMLGHLVEVLDISKPVEDNDPVRRGLEERVRQSLELRELVNRLQTKR